MTALCTLLLAAASAADPGQPPADYFKEMDYYVGTWTGQGKIGNDPFEGRFTCEQLPGQTGYLFRLAYHTKGGPEQHLTIFSGWDPGSQRIVGVSRGSDGTVQRSTTIRYGPELSESEYTGFDGQGRKLTGKSRDEKKPNRYTFRMIDSRADGQPGPEVAVEWTRQPAPTPATADAYLKFFRPLVGTWTTQFKEGDKVKHHEWIIELSPTGRCLVTTEKEDGKPWFQSVDGFDPVTGRWTTAGFYADGGWESFSCAMDPATLARGLVGHGTTGLSRGVNGKGEKTSAVVTSSLPDPNTIVLRLTDVRTGDRKEPDLELKYTRKKPGPAPVADPPAPAAPAGAAEVSPAYAHLKVLEPIVGQWRTRGEFNGRPLPGDIECHWLPGQSALAWTGWLGPTSDGPRQYGSSALIVWDAKDKVIKEHATVANGDTWVTLMRPAGPNKITFDRTYTAPDGQTSTDTFVMTLAGDKIVFTDSQRKTPDGKVVGAWRNSVFTRVAPDPGAALGLPPLGDDPPTAKEYLDFWNRYFVGTWDVRLPEGPFPGKAGVQEIRQAPGGSSLQFRARIEGKDYFSGAGGYDPATRSWKEVLFLNDGGILTEHHRIPRGILTGDPAGKTLTGVTTAVRPDGTVERSTHRIDILDKDTYLYTATPGQVDGNTRAPIKTESKRQPK